MTKNPIPASQALKQAYEALQRGDKQAARHWAQVAARTAPEMEDPWLILAAVAKPRASIVYLERARALNPHSERVRKGLEWAGNKLKEETQPVRVMVEKPSHQVTAPAGTKPITPRGKPSARALPGPSQNPVFPTGH